MAAYWAATQLEPRRERVAQYFLEQFGFEVYLPRIRAMEDRTRSVNFHAAWDSPSDRIREAAHYYAEDLWREQHYRPELWIEKSALLGIIEGVCDEFRVPYATIGNNSQLLQHEAAVRFAPFSTKV